MRLLSQLLKRFVRKGKLRVVDHTGAATEFGSGEDGPTVTIKLGDRALEWKLFFNPELAAPEAYMDGSLTFENDSTLYDFLFLFSINRQDLRSHPWQRALRRYWRAMRRFTQHNLPTIAKRNARSHYDISPELYRLFLDRRMQYSCGYFEDPEATLEDAQAAKMRHIGAKLNLRPGMSVAEIGSGWGGLAIYLAKTFDVKVTAINVSPEQLAVARKRARDEGLADQIEFLERDYREVEGRFDRIVSIGMMEHVGVPYYDAYFGKVREMLTDDGFALIHAIGRTNPPGGTAPFVGKYIFPGGYTPALSEVFASVERARLWTCDAEILRLHYYYTIRHWRRRFAQNRDEAKALYDERFCRMWEFYLIGVEMGFLHGSNMVFQLLLSRTRDAVPITRDYMYEAERALRNAEAEAGLAKS